MPTIKQQVAANQTRIAAGGETGTGVGPQDVAATTMAPSQDLPAGGGLPQRGMFPANLTLNSDRSDSNRAFRGDGMRSSTFPFAPPTISNTIVEKAQSSASSSSSSALSGLSPGPGISITASGKGFTVSGTTGTLQMPNIFSVGGALPVTAFPDGGPMIVGLVGEPTGTFFAAPALSSHPPSLDVVTQASGTAANATATATPSSSPDFAMYFITAAASGSYQNGTISAGWTTVFITTPARIGVYSQSGITGPTSVTDTDSFTQWASVLALFATQNSTPTIVQNTSAGFVTGSGSATFGSSLTAGNTVIAAFGGNYASITSVSDSEGNTYRLVGTSSETVGGTTLTVTVYAASNVLGGTAATVNFTASSVSNADIWIGELSNFGTVLGQPSFRIIVNTDLDGAIFGASGTNHNAGAVPDPGGTAGSTRFLNEDATWMTAVTSLGISVTVPSIFSASVSGSPVTTSGTIGITLSLQTENANTVLAGPTSGAAATPTFRALVAADLPFAIGGASIKTANYTAVAGDSGTLLSFNASSALAIVQDSGQLQGTGSGTNSINLANLPSKGNFLVACVLSSVATAPVISGGGVGTWTQVGTQQNRGDGNYFGQIFIGVVNSAPSKTIQATNLGAFWGIAAYEISGTPPTLTTESEAQGSSTGTTLSHGVTTTVTGDLVLGLFYIALGTSTSWTAAAGFTTIPGTGVSANTWFLADVVGAASTYTPQINWGGSSADWGYIVFGVKPGTPSAVTLTLPSTPPSSTWSIYVQNIGAISLTIDPNGLQIDGSASAITGITAGQGLYLTTDGTNYFTMRGGA